MAGGGRASHYEERRRGEVVDNLGGGEQTGHNMWRGPNDIAKQLGVSGQEAQDMYDAIYGFTYGWDAVMRARQRGADLDELKGMDGTMKAIRDDFGGDEGAYLKELDKRIANSDKLIEMSPKWNGGELYRGYALSQGLVDEFTSGNVVNLNFGNGSWTTAEHVSGSFARNNVDSSQPVKFIAHTTQKRNATSVRGLSHYYSEQEVYGSHKEAFVCTKTQEIGGYVHAWFDVVDYNHDWGYKKKK